MPVRTASSGTVVLRRAGVFLVVAALLVGQPSSLMSKQEETLEYRIKAAFLYNFARFVEWPDESTRGVGHVVIGILGEDPFGSILDETVRGKKADGRPLLVKRLTNPEEAVSCALVFVGSSERKRTKTLLASLERLDVLTVGESADFLDQGGMVNFVIEKERVRIDLNLHAARAAGLRVSSQLIRVAREVRRD